MCFECNGLGKQQCSNCTGTGKEFEVDYSTSNSSSSDDKQSNTNYSNSNDYDNSYSDVNQGESYYKQGLSYAYSNPEKAAELWLLGAQNGHPKCMEWQKKMGQKYYTEGLKFWPNDKEKTIELMKKANKYGNIDAQIFLTNNK